jgi:uncharacterized membrane protein YdbT with pleckstrin-like domain
MPKQLLAGERLMLSPIHRHWILLVRGLVPLGVFLLVVLVVFDVSLRDLLPGDVRLWVSVAALAFAGLWAGGVFLGWTGDALTVTNQRVVLEEGVLRRSSRVIPIGRVQDVSTEQSMLGRALGYGTVEIDAAGSSGERFAYVTDPERLRDDIFALATRLQRDA